MDGWWGCRATAPGAYTPKFAKKTATAQCFEPLNLTDSQFVAKEVGKKSLFLLPLECQLACSALG